jgi:hypothetical protein
MARVERYAVEPVTDLDDNSDIRWADREVRLTEPRTFHEELD